MKKIVIIIGLGLGCVWCWNYGIEKAKKIYYERIPSEAFYEVKKITEMKGENKVLVDGSFGIVKVTTRRYYVSGFKSEKPKRGRWYQWNADSYKDFPIKLRLSAEGPRRDSSQKPELPLCYYSLPDKKYTHWSCAVPLMKTGERILITKDKPMKISRDIDRYGKVSYFYMGIDFINDGDCSFGMGIGEFDDE